MNHPNSEIYKVTFDYRPLYLFASVSGETDDSEIYRQFWFQVAEEFRKTEYGKLLVVEDMEETASLTEMFEIASAIPRLFPGVRIAFVDHYEEHRKINEFCETVAINRGAYKKYFTDFEEAEIWLLS